MLPTTPYYFYFNLPGTFTRTLVVLIMVFRVDAKNFAITFPATATLPFDKQQLLDHLSSITGVIYTLVCKELHETGVPHFHALVTFGRRKNVRDPRFFDYMGAHANVQAVRNLGQWIDYVKKDGDYIEHGEPPELTAPQRDRSRLPLINEFNSELAWLTACLEGKVPAGYAIRMWQLHQQLDCLTVNADYQPPAAAQVCDALSSLSLPDDDFKSIVLIGPSGVGKTIWAKSKAPKPALFVSSADDLRHLRPEHKAIIFDDCNFNHWPRESQIHLVDRYEPRSIRIRYTNALLPQGILRIFTANTDPILLSDEAIRRRVRVYRLGEGMGRSLS